MDNLEISYSTEVLLKYVPSQMAAHICCSGNDTVLEMGYAEVKVQDLTITTTTQSNGWKELGFEVGGGLCLNPCPDLCESWMCVSKLAFYLT